MKRKKVRLASLNVRADSTKNENRKVKTGPEKNVKCGKSGSELGQEETREWPKEPPGPSRAPENRPQKPSNWTFWSFFWSKSDSCIK